jgi:nitrite reductase/ring-hydroxylating ferredoxin subunit
MPNVTVCRLDDVPEQGNKAFDVDGVSVLICRSAGQLYAVENRCSHNQSALEGGKVRGHALFCPVHGARFDLRDGSTAGALTKTSIRTFAIEATADNRVLVRVEEKAE